MTPEWKELKAWIKTHIRNVELMVVVNKMEEIESRTLPERVAKLIEGFDHGPWSRTRSLSTIYWSSEFGEIVRNALITGDTSELEKWQVKK